MIPYEASLGTDVLQALADARGTVTTTIFPAHKNVRVKRRKKSSHP